MKIALYIEDGLEQLVLTPQSDHEAALLSKLDAPDRLLEIRHGVFFECRGGYYRYAPSYLNQYVGGERMSDKSTMIVLRQKPPVKEASNV